MSTTELSPDCENVTRLYELSRNGERENTEFQQLERQIYDKMIETYCQAPRDGEAESIS